MISVTPASAADARQLAELRHTLWPHGSVDEHIADASTTDQLRLIARLDDGTAVGFGEASIRRDYVNGCDTSPVGFLEGIYVVPAAPGRGIARRLVAAAEAWAASCGCTELASDAALSNIESHRMHGALGFAETERVVYFRKLLGHS
jgi:aminoglycoside 6'-N-acetyltransferase I